MFTRSRLRPSGLKPSASSSSSSSSSPTYQCTNHPRHINLTSTYATAAATVTKPPPDLPFSAPPIQRHPPTQPPSHKPPELRKSQLHRAYTSLLRSTPLILLFQHSNLTASELAGIRRELQRALRTAGAAAGAETTADDPVAEAVKLQVVQTGMLTAALRVVEFYRPEAHGQSPGAPLSAAEQAGRAQTQSQQYTHALSRTAHDSTLQPDSPKNPHAPPRKKHHPLHALLSGPIALLTFPSLSPTHLAAALSILAPTKGSASAFPAPKRRHAPGYYENAVQNGLQKLILLGGRVDERLGQRQQEQAQVLDIEGVKMVGGLAARGGLEGLRAEIVALLQGAGMGLVGGLESVALGVWGTMEGRRRALEEEEGGGGGQDQ